MRIPVTLLGCIFLSGCVAGAGEHLPSAAEMATWTPQERCNYQRGSVAALMTNPMTEDSEKRMILQNWLNGPCMRGTQ